MSLVARITLPDGKVTANSTITVWDGDVSIKEIPVPLKAGVGGHWALARVIAGLRSIGFRIVDVTGERKISGGSEFDVERA